jgi:alpha-galactosidase
MNRHAAILLLALALTESPIMAANDFVPAEEPNDSVMASAAEVAEMAEWAAAAFTGARPAADPPAVSIEVRRQDHNVLRFGQSILQTPLTIGKRQFKRGLGTHANSEIAVAVPQGAKTFRASVGVDNNYDTGGRRGTVQFAVDAGGKEVFRSEILKGGGEPVEVAVEIPAGAAQLVLKADATADGAAYDHADWADAHFVMADGRQVWLDEKQPAPAFLMAEPPFSFVYGGKPSASILAGWQRTAESKDLKDRTVHTIRWTDPKTRLAVTAAVSVFRRYPAVEWLLAFENQGSADTPLLESIQALDTVVGTMPDNRPAVVHRIAGDDCSERSFMPIDTPLGPGQNLRLAPSGGRSSNGTFPFFNLECEDRGLFTAIGWSGQWAATLDRGPAGLTRVKAGMELTRLALHPGEKIRSPRILLMAWRGDRTASHNRFRRLMLFHYVPQEGGRPAAIPVFWQGYDRYNARSDWASQSGQIHAAQLAAKTGCEFLWLDAAWFPGNFPNGVGNWTAKPKEFPRGLRPVSDECHRLGLKFIVWFEPERVAAGSEIARLHQEFVFGGEKGGLFKLSDPAARQWLTRLLNQRIDEFGMDWYRNDFNIDPLPFWRAADAPDRQGMTEIRYVEGLYEMWDAMRSHHPGLLIDNCASGGRRIDLETCMRAVPLWQSDTACSPGHPEWNQAQMHGLSLYLPFHEACAWTPDAYEMRGTCASGAIVQFGFLDPGFSVEKAREAVAEAKENRKYWYGDFYPLTPCTAATDRYHAIQFHRADLGEGMVLAFRRRLCSTVGIIAELQAIDPAAQYAVECIDEARHRTARTMPGEELRTNLPLRIPQKPGSLLVRYRQLGKAPP